MIFDKEIYDEELEARASDTGLLDTILDLIEFFTGDLTASEVTGHHVIPAHEWKEKTYVAFCCKAYVVERHTFSFTHGHANGWNSGPFGICIRADANGILGSAIISSEARGDCVH